MGSARKLLFSLVSGAFLATGAAAQKSEPAVTGWHFTPMPNFYYSTDVGLSLGAFCDFFNSGLLFTYLIHLLGFLTGLIECLKYG